MNVKEAAKQLEINPRTVYHLCAAGVLGHVRIGVGRGAIRITPDDITQFLRDAREKSAKPKVEPAPYVLKNLKPQPRR